MYTWMHRGHVFNIASLVHIADDPGYLRSGSKTLLFQVFLSVDDLFHRSLFTDSGNRSLPVVSQTQEVSEYQKGGAMVHLSKVGRQAIVADLD